ncbi:Flagellin protein FlaA [Bacillus mycoides]|uniref:Flagellin N-terminal domain-containing protein n=1 Tax=Bacillus mycoides TaxID=1405 RepID=A0A0D6STY7_BACMY|nr:hypothetical protein IKO_01110 [Bacillus cereus VDM034]EJS13068.1 hypothetical protein IKS_04065 [Bacillus cereus VDM062]KIV72009.1 Flagellin protein FlaA [Bacillus mycoides]MBJ7957630.1 hypothetical protein [Bacillus cereus group sp. N28]PRD11119.1 hypothetical protein CQ058_05350 [Bacillus sp. MYb56]RAN73568.1 hypothetical protein B5P40_00330 [Bacillus sp. SRB_8]
MRISTNVLSMNAKLALYKNEQSINVGMERLATGKKLNAASDNPANVTIVTRMRDLAVRFAISANSFE